MEQDQSLLVEYGAQTPLVVTKALTLKPKFSRPEWLGLNSVWMQNFHLELSKYSNILKLTVTIGGMGVDAERKVTILTPKAPTPNTANEVSKQYYKKSASLPVLLAKRKSSSSELCANLSRAQGM